MTKSALQSTLTIGTRTSALALWQTHHIIDQLQAAWPGLPCQLQPFVTQGDKTLDKPLPTIGGKGLFTAELEGSLLAGKIDLAVHSLKDLPVADAPGLTIGAITSRADVRDALVARNGWTLATLPQGAVVGTSSTRRAAQLLTARPDLIVRSIRGNVDTRVRKVRNGDYDATLLALAGLERLGLDAEISERLTLEVMLPAPGQGALAVQCRADDQATLTLLAAIDDAAVRAAVTAERAFLHRLGGGCSAPVAAYAQVSQRSGNLWIHLQGLVASADGQQIIRVTGEFADPMQAEELATQALAQGAAALVAQKAGFVETIPHPSPPRAQGAPEGGSQSTPALLIGEGGSQSSPPLLAGEAGKGWSKQLLAAKRIVVTRTPEQSVTLIDQLTALGATPILLPTIRIEPLADLSALRAALHARDRYDWLIFTSANAVAIVGEQLRASGLAPTDLKRLQIASIGPATTAALAQLGLTPTFVPERFLAEEVVTGLQVHVGDLRGVRVLLPQAAIARQNLAEALTAQGVLVDTIPIYQTLPAKLDQNTVAELQQGVDVITFTSGSTVRNFMQGLADSPIAPATIQSAMIACIGPQTARAAQEVGLRVELVAADHSAAGLVAALVAHFQA